MGRLIHSSSTVIGLTPPVGTGQADERGTEVPEDLTVASGLGVIAGASRAIAAGLGVIAGACRPIVAGPASGVAASTAGPSAAGPSGCAESGTTPACDEFEFKNEDSHCIYVVLCLHPMWI